MAILIPQLNVDFEVFKLGQARQREGESMDQFHTRVRELASSTDEDQPKAIRRQIIQGCRDKTLRGLILRKPGISLEDILILARSHELSNVRATAMEQALHKAPIKTETIKVERADAVRSRPRGPPQKEYRRDPPRTRCGYCGHEPHAAKDCPAQGKTCANCGIPNHFASVCRRKNQSKNFKRSQTPTKAVRQLSLTDPPLAKAEKHLPTVYDDSKSEDEEAYIVSFARELKQRRRPQPTCIVQMGENEVKAIIDTGATVNVMGLQQFNKLHPRPEVLPSKTRIFAYGADTPLPLKGKIIIPIQADESEVMATVHIINREADTLLSSHTADDLKLIAFANRIRAHQVD
ncbi:uncharacterized protein LOC144785863 isoform X1 [Lissotriton helveticus]